MANILKKEKQIAVISALAEGSSIRSIERVSGVNQNTIMTLGKRVGYACEKIMDEQMRNLSCSKIQMDEIWGFVGKKQRNLKLSIFLLKPFVRRVRRRMCILIVKFCRST